MCAGQQQREPVMDFDLVLRDARLPDSTPGEPGIDIVVKDGRIVALARGHSPTQRVMVEQYLDGPQVSTESRCRQITFISSRNS